MNYSQQNSHTIQTEKYTCFLLRKVIGKNIKYQEIVPPIDSIMISHNKSEVCEIYISKTIRI